MIYQWPIQWAADIRRSPIYLAVFIYDILRDIAEAALSQLL